MSELQKLIVFVYNQLFKSSNNSLISEYAKRETSWKLLKDEGYKTQIDENPVCFASLISFLITKTYFIVL